MGNPDTNWEEAFNRFEQAVVSGSEALQVKAITKLARVSKFAPQDILAATIPILARLLGENNFSGNLTRSIQQAAAYCLKQIASQADGALATEIGQSGVINSVLRLFPQSDDSLRTILVKCLRVFVTFGNENRVIVARNGGLEIVIDLLNSCNDGTRRYLLEILSALALLREVRRILICLGGLRYLVEAVSFGSMVSRERACQAIGLLAVTGRARRLLVELGVIPGLVELFHIGDWTTKLVAGNTLGVVAAHVEYITPVAEAGAIPLYAELLQGPDSTGYKHSVPVIRNSGAIPILVNLLRGENDEVREKVSGAIAQLSYNEADRVALADAGAVPIMIELLHDESEELRDNAAESLINFSEDPLQHERISEAIGIPSFQSMQSRLTRIRASDDLMARSMRRMSIEQLTWDPDLV
ncbi:ARM repeat superfamily protein [Citrus sinensis]|nr:ARM repeat superfamily protein [Citrus sinensis]